MLICLPSKRGKGKRLNRFLRVSYLSVIHNGVEDGISLPQEDKTFLLKGNIEFEIFTWPWPMFTRLFTSGEPVTTTAIPFMRDTKNPIIQQ